ncbi:MAG: flagellar motor protein MotB [Gammaproteobacteria bacterium]|nr:flagellar motor protein MotB [Gammaproteobacteria bacterium]
MKKKSLRVLAAFLAMIAAGSAWAAGPSARGETYINLFGGNTFFDQAAGLGLGSSNNGGVAGLRLGRRIDAHLGVEAQVAAAFAHLQGEVKGGSAGQYSGAVIGNLYAFASPSTPYLSLGLGASSNLFGNRLGRSTELMGVFGVGYQQFLGRHFGLRLDVQDQMLFNSPVLGGRNLNDVQVTGGVSYFWGGRDRNAFPVIGPKGQ